MKGVFVREREISAEEMRSLAAQLLRAHRNGDQAAFIRAMNRAEGRVPELLISLATVANRSIDAAVGPENANSAITRIVEDLPAPRGDAEIADDVWRDAVALVEAMTNDDDPGARSILGNTPDMPMLFGMVLHTYSLLLGSLEESAKGRFVAELRGIDSPPFS
jgi:hypothetical protein